MTTTTNPTVPTPSTDFVVIDQHSRVLYRRSPDGAVTCPEVDVHLDRAGLPPGSTPDRAAVMATELQGAKLRLAAALEIAHRYGSTEGAHHKTWVIDQMVRTLAGDDYPAFVARVKAGEDGPNTYRWDEGIAP